MLNTVQTSRDWALINIDGDTELKQITSEKELKPEMVGRRVWMRHKETAEVFDTHLIKENASANGGYFVSDCGIGYPLNSVLDRLEIHLIPTLAEALEADAALESIAEALKGFVVDYGDMELYGMDSEGQGTLGELEGFEVLVKALAQFSKLKEQK